MPVRRVRRLAVAIAAVLVALAVPAAMPPAALGGTVPMPPSGTARPAAAPLPPATPLRVRAAAAGLDSPMLPLGLDGHGALAVPPDGAATGWYTGGPAPGARGPAVLTAHVDWNHEPGPFFRLHRLAPGDLVTVDRADGRTATFEVQAVRRYPKTRFPTRQVYGDLPGAGLRLVTCGGSFDRGARSYRDNVVVYAGLVEP
ncbi:class F sortase [Pseudonocardia phyllosphaerae]|uniref:class F sortase n=1 Tax=Pseudonocardia phyllosphaerae TaxID=3390502 RepID=UPI00397A571A